MASSLPRLPSRAEHALVKRVCRLSPRVQRRLFGAPPVIDGQRLASDIHALISLAELAGDSSFTGGLSPEGARKLSRQGSAATAAHPPIPMARVEALMIPGPGGPLPARRFVPNGLPAGEPAPLLLYFHGGGWVIGDLDTHDDVCRFLATTTGIEVVAVDYRLSPEHPFPAAVEDAWASFTWAVTNAGELGFDPARIAVGGDSAGGNLSAVVSLLARAGGGAMPAQQLLIYPRPTPPATCPRACSSPRASC